MFASAFINNYTSPRGANPFKLRFGLIILLVFRAVMIYYVKLIFTRIQGLARMSTKPIA